MGAMNTARIEAVAGPPPQYMRNALLLNAGQSRFMEVAYLAGLADSDWSWAAKLADLNNDGRVDAFVTNGRDPQLQRLGRGILQRHADRPNRVGHLSRYRTSTGTEPRFSKPR